MQLLHTLHSGAAVGPGRLRAELHDASRFCGCYVPSCLAFAGLRWGVSGGLLLSTVMEATP